MFERYRIAGSGSISSAVNCKRNVRRDRGDGVQRANWPAKRSPTRVDRNPRFFSIGRFAALSR
jgi:hypothetical protein